MMYNVLLNGFTGTRRCLLSVLLIFAVLIPAMADAASSPDEIQAHENIRILVVSSRENNLYEQIYALSIQKITTLCQETKSCQVKEFHFDQAVIDALISTKESLERYDFIVTLGIRAAIHLREAGNISKNTLIINALLPGKSVMQTDSKIHKVENHYQLLLDQPFQRQLDFIKNLLPKTEKIGVLLSKKHYVDTNKLINTAKNKGMDLLIDIVPDPEKTGTYIRILAKKVDVFLILPDKTIYNSHSIREILLTGYYEKVPFIGYSKALTKIGALASLVTEKPVVAKDIASLVIRLLTGKKVDIVNYPSSSGFVINQHVADSLDLKLPSPAKVREAMKP